MGIRGAAACKLESEIQIIKSWHGEAVEKDHVHMSAVDFARVLHSKMCDPLNQVVRWQEVLLTIAD